MIMNQMGRIVGIPGFAGSKTDHGFTYDENSALASLKMNNGVTTTYQRDGNGRVSSINAIKSGNPVLGLNYVYDDANNIIQRNDNSYVYDKVSRLTQATIRGVFEDKFTKADKLMGIADKDYKGEKDPEQDVTDQTEIKLDYAARSLILNLQTEAENISRVELAPQITGHRFPQSRFRFIIGMGFHLLRWKKASG